jgi:hypothetical protein
MLGRAAEMQFLGNTNKGAQKPCFDHYRCHQVINQAIDQYWTDSEQASTLAAIVFHRERG